MSPSALIFDSQIGVLRRPLLATADDPPATYDDWNADAYGPEALVRTVPGRVRVVEAAEGETYADDGPTRVAGRGWLMYADLRVGDRVRQPDGRTWDVRGVRTAPPGDWVIAELVRVDA